MQTQFIEAGLQSKDSQVSSVQYSNVYTELFIKYKLQRYPKVFRILERIPRLTNRNSDINDGTAQLI